MKTINTTKAPIAIGPYSQAIEVNGFIFSSGQIPLTPSGELVEVDIQKQTHQVIQNAEEVLRAAGSNLSSVVKVTLFIKDMNQFQQINEVYSEYFKDYKPARSCVEVARLPKDVLIEMEVIAKKD